MEELIEWFSGFRIWMRWFGLILGIIALFLIGHFSSYWVSLGVFLWAWSTNIDNNDL